MPYTDLEKRKLRARERQRQVSIAKRQAKGLPPNPTLEERKARAEKARATLAKAREIQNSGDRPRSGLPLGAIKAIQAMRHRLPLNATPEMAEVAGFAFGRMVDVLAGKVPSKKAPQVLNAAREIRAELCGPVQQKIEMAGGMSLEMLVARASQEEPDESTVPALPRDGSEVQ